MQSPRVIADPILGAQEYRLEILLQGTNDTPVRNVSSHEPSLSEQHG